MTASSAFQVIRVRERLGLHAGRPTVTILVLVGHFLIVVTFEDHDIRVSVLGMGREVAIVRCIPVLATATTDLHDL